MNGTACGLRSFKCALHAAMGSRIDQRTNKRAGFEGVPDLDRRIGALQTRHEGFVHAFMHEQAA